METLKYFFCLCLIIAPAIQANPASLPSIEVSEEQLKITAGDSGSVTCTPQGNPLPSVQWRKVDGEFGYGTVTIGNTLSIGDAQDSDGGNYVCVGVLGDTEVAQKYVYVDIENLDRSAQESPSVTVSEKIVSIPKGGSGSVECTPAGNPRPRVQWIKSNGELRSGVRANENTLIISDAREEDEGHYVCQGIVDGTVMITDFAAVTIENVVRSAQSNLKVIVSQRTLLIPLGGRGTIECTPEGTPLPRIEWIKSDGEFSKGISRSGNTLIISDAREEDRGHYVCQGIVDGTVLLTDYTSVEIDKNSATAALEKPKVSVSVEQLKIPAGKSGSITCNPGGSPLPSIQWRKHEGEYSAGTSVIGNTLTITNAQESDRGNYLCVGVVSNAVVAQKYVNIEIERVSQTPSQRNLRLILSEQQLRIPEGGTGTIECTPEGDPLPRVQWIKSNGGLRNGIIQRGNTLTISDAQIEDRGHYACQGIVDGTVMLTNYSAVDIERRSSPPVTSQPPQSLQSTEGNWGGNPKITVSERQPKIPLGGSASIECTPEGNPLPRVQWIKSNGEFRNGIGQSGNTLVISDAREEDRGHYVCQGIVDGTVLMTDFSTIDIERNEGVSQTPSQRNLRLILSEQQLRIPEGGTGTIECTPEGDPLPRVQWIKSNSGLRNGIIQRGNTLTISDAHIEDRGHYACQGIVDGTVMLTNYSAVDIERRSPPSVTSQPPQSLQSTEGNRGGNPKITVSERQPKIPLGGSASIECTPEGNPLPRVQWIKSNGEFRNGIGQSGNTLVISDAREEDRGHYVCQGIVDGTVLMTDFSTIDIERNEGTPVQFPKPLEVVIPEGSNYMISCDFVTGDLEQEVAWTKSDGPLPKNAQVLGQQLFIYRAKKEDSGDYLCKVTASRGGFLLRVAYARLEVLALPHVSVHPRTQTVTRGQAVTIECVVDGDLVEVTWDRGDGSNLSSRVENQGSKIYFNGIEAEDAGYYRCSARNRAGISSGLSQVIVNGVEPSPAQLPGYLKLIVSQRQVIIPKGGSGSIECTPEGNPLPRVQWTKSNGEFRDGIRQSGNTLIISDAREEDRGHYACQGIVAGTVMLTNYTAVDIRDEPQQAPPANLRSPNVVVSQKQLSLYPGESVSIECTPEGSPLPRIQWIKSNGEFSAGVTQNANTLTISYAQAEDEGHYVCQGVVDGTVMVTDFSAISVQDKDEEPPAELPRYLKLIVSQRQVIIPKGGSGSIDCTPEGNPLPRVKWIKSNGEFRDGIRQSGNTLIISDAREEDRGHYACQGIVAGTVMLTNYTAVDIRDEPQQAPPANLRSPNVVVSQKQLSLSLGESVSIECTPEGSPVPRIQWMKSNGEFSAGVTQNGNTLTISYAQKEDEGHYVCQGVVDGTVMVTDFSAISVQNEKPPAQLPEYLKLIVSQRQVIIPKGGSGSIECTPEGNPLPRVQWIKSNGEFGNGIRQSGNTLIISDAREEDRGHYACQGIVAGTVMLTDYTAVDIRDEPQQAPPANLRSPNVVVSQKQLSLYPGESVSIECTPEGSPLPRIQWIKSNGEFSAGVTQNGNTLTISYAQAEDEGHYVCQGVVDGTVMVTDFSAISVQDKDEEPPAELPRYLKLIVSQRQVIIPKGGSGSIDCTPEGNPLPRVQWIKSNGEFRDGIRQSGNTLIISDAREEDRGHYACQGIVAGTVMLTNYTAVDIRGNEPISQSLSYPRVAVHVRHLKIPRGGTMSVECTPEGSPLPTVQWSKDGGNFGVGTRQSGNSLLISDAQEEDRGNYVCSAIVDGYRVSSDYLTVEIQYICELPQEPGHCYAAKERWYYDTTQHRCQKFIWGGCGGNKNNFDTEEQCSLECEHTRP